MSIASAIRRRAPTSLKAAVRPAVSGAAVLWRRALYAVRFAGRNVRIDPTSWVAWKAIIRCTDGGEVVIGRGCEIHAFAMIDACGGSVRLGDYCSLNPFAIVYGHGGTTIGNHVRIAAHAVIIPANHDFRSTASLHEAGVRSVGITIGDDVWLGAGARVLDGVEIGSRSVVGAGAVVTRSVPAGCVAKGVPARAVEIGAAGGSD